MWVKNIFLLPKKSSQIIFYRNNNTFKWIFFNVNNVAFYSFCLSGKLWRNFCFISFFLLIKIVYLFGIRCNSR